jgi:hypothetical protein
MSERMLKLDRVAVRDRAVRDIDGAHLLVPEGWRVEGGFAWMPLYSMQANLLLRVSDPRTGAAVEWLPAQQFIWPTQPMPGPVQPWSNWNGSVMLPPPSTAAEFVQAFYLPGPLRHLQGARLVGAEELPRVAAESARAAGAGATARAARLRYAYQAAGRAWEEDVHLTLTFGQPSVVMMWWCQAYAMRAPAGELDRLTPVLSIPVQSLQLTADWSATLEAVRHLFRQGVRQQMADTQRLGELAAQYREEARRQQQQVSDERLASQDRQHHAVREALGGVETYIDPFDARAVQLPQGYRDCWVNAQGQVILSNDVLFDPRQGSTRDWRRMGRWSP